jgi:hypothetical protein
MNFNTYKPIGVLIDKTYDKKKLIKTQRKWVEMQTEKINYQVYKDYKD